MSFILILVLPFICLALLLIEHRIYKIKVASEKQVELLEILIDAIGRNKTE